jgi:hypothetical protein
MELCYAMPDMGHAYCSLGDALLCGRFIAAAPGAGDVVTRYCYSGLWIMDRRERISRQVQVLAQGLPYAVVLVLVWKMLEVALLLHDQGAVHADTKSGNFLVDPSPLIPLVQRLLAAAAAAAKLEGAAAEELLAAAFQPEEWTQVAAMLQVRVLIDSKTFHPLPPDKLVTSMYTSACIVAILNWCHCCCCHCRC